MSDVHPAVSIIVSIYNVEDYLEQCLDSIVAQSFSDIEIILVDDGGTDGSYDICSRYAALDERIILLHQDNSGVSDARNRGLGAASGDWIMFVDGDDWLTTDAVEILYGFAAQADGYDIAIGSYFQNFSSTDQQERFEGDSSQFDKTYTYELDACRDNLIRFALVRTGMTELAQINCNFNSIRSKLFRHSMLTENNLLFISGLDKGEDRIFNLYTLKIARNLIVINAPFYHYRIRQDSISRKFTGIEALSEPIDIWVGEVKKFLNGFPENTDDIYAGFLYSVLNIVSGYFVRALNFGILSRRETLKNMRILFNGKNYRNMIRTISANRKSEYFTKRNRIVIAMFRTRSYFLYLAASRLSRRIKAGPTA